MTALHLHPLLLAVAAGHGEQRVIVFFAQVLLLIVVGRLLSELMQRIGQPAVIGQLLAGIILGPSVFGAIWPAAQEAIFPLNSSDPANAQCCLRAWRAASPVIDRHGDRFGSRVLEPTKSVYLSQVFQAAFWII